MRFPALNKCHCSPHVQKRAGLFFVSCTILFNKENYMSGILLPDGVNIDEEVKEEATADAPAAPEYQATEEDEERFFLMYHMNFQPSEVEKIAPTYRKWLIMRFVAQKHMEQDAVQKQKLMQQIGPNLKMPGR